jgi:hypothetical protein
VAIVITPRAPKIPATPLGVKGWNLGVLKALLMFHGKRKNDSISYIQYQK